MLIKLVVWGRGRRLSTKPLHVRELFSKLGPDAVTTVRVCKDETGKCRGHADVRFQSPELAKVAARLPGAASSPRLPFPVAVAQYAEFGGEIPNLNRTFRKVKSTGFEGPRPTSCEIWVIVHLKPCLL